MSSARKRHCTVMPTQVSDDLLDHVFEHASAVLWVKEGEKLLLVQQLVCWRVIGLEPAVLQTFQYLLGCGNTTNRLASIILNESSKWNLYTHFRHGFNFDTTDGITTRLSNELRKSSIKKK